MRYVSYESVMKALNGNTRSVQNWGHFLGSTPERLGLAATLYPQHTSMQLLDRLYNIHKMPAPKDQFQSVKSNCFTWGIKTNKIKQVQITRNVTTDGRNGSEVLIVLRENYFHPNDTFVINESRDVLFVTAPAVQVGPNEFQYTCRFVTTDLSKGLDVSKAVVGNAVRFRSNYFPEASEKRYTRYQSNVERHRNYLSLHGVEERKTGEYALRERTFVEASMGKDGKNIYFEMTPVEKHCYDEFMEVRNNHLLFGESNHDEQGRCLIQTPDGRDIPMGDGLITQAERYAEKFGYSELTESIMIDIIQVMRQKSQNVTGNSYVILCNERFYDHFQFAMREVLKTLQLAANAFYSKTEGTMTLDVGANFETYHYGGNTISIIADKAMSDEYGRRGYGIVLDVTKDLESGKPAMELFTLEGADMLTGTLRGLGGTDGKSSGEVSTMLHGSGYAIVGYSGAALYNPYRSFIIQENVYYAF